MLLGGIFLGASLVGMLPEVREIFNQQNIGWNGYMLVKNTFYSTNNYKKYLIMNVLKF